MLLVSLILTTQQCWLALILTNQNQQGTSLLLRVLGGRLFLIKGLRWQQVIAE